MDPVATTRPAPMLRVDWRLGEDDTVFCAGGLAEACFFILQGRRAQTRELHRIACATMLRRGFCYPHGSVT